MTRHSHKRYRKYSVHETHTGFAGKLLLVFCCGLFVFTLGVNALLQLNDLKQGIAFITFGFFMMLPMVWKVFSTMFE